MNWKVIAGLGIVILVAFVTQYDIVKTELTRQDRAVQGREQGQRVPIQTPTMSGSINLRGASLDDLLLSNLRYKESQIRLFEPNRKYSRWGWTGETGTINSEFDEWTLVEGDVLTPETPITIGIDYETGITLRRTYEVDQDNLFTVTQHIANHQDSDIQANPYGALIKHRQNNRNEYRSYHTYEGAITNLNGNIHRIPYDETTDIHDTQNTWHSGIEYAGFIDTYTLATMIPSDGTYGATVVSRNVGPGNTYNMIVTPDVATSVSPGNTQTYVNYLYAGPNSWKLLRQYQSQIPVDSLEDVTLHGWFQQLVVKPMRSVFFFFEDTFQSMGVAILATMLVAKIFLFPLALNGYASHLIMMKSNQSFRELEKEHGPDRSTQIIRQRMKADKIDLLGVIICLAMELTVLYAFYILVITTPEFQNVGFYGFVDDLSLRGERNLTNLFGALDFQVPEIFRIGFWPVFYVFTVLFTYSLPRPWVKSWPTRGKCLAVWLIAVAYAPAAVAIWIWGGHVVNICKQMILQRKFK